MTSENPVTMGLLCEIVEDPRRAGGRLIVQPRSSAFLATKREAKGTYQLDKHPSCLPLLEVHDLLGVLSLPAAAFALLLDASYPPPSVTAIVRAEDQVAQAKDSLRFGEVAVPIGEATE